MNVALNPNMYEYCNAISKGIILFNCIFFPPTILYTHISGLPWFFFLFIYFFFIIYSMLNENTRAHIIRESANPI